MSAAKIAAALRTTADRLDADIYESTEAQVTVAEALRMLATEIEKR